MNKKKVAIITGGLGFIGINLADKLLKQDYVVYIFSKKNTSAWRIIRNKNLFIDNTPLSNLRKLKQSVEKIKPSAVFHLSAYGGRSTQNDIQEMVDSNIQATLNLLQATLEINYSVFVNTGSSSEYGFKSKPMRETDYLEPNSFYGATKASSTYLCRVFAEKLNKPIVTFRPFSVFGPYEDKSRFIPTALLALMNKQTIKLTQKPVRRDFIYVDDLVGAYLRAIRFGKKLKGKVINLGTGKEHSNDEIVQTIFKVTKKNVSISKGGFPERSWDTSHWVANIDLAKKIFGWQPKISLEQGIKKTYEWFLKNRNLYE